MSTKNFLVNSPKFGALDFENANASAQISGANNATFGVKYSVGGNDYYFVPETYVQRGVVNEGKQLYSQTLLDKDNLNRLYTESELVDLGPDINNPASNLGSKGFLMPTETYQDLFATGRKTYDINRKVGKAKVGEITGFGEIKGNLVYSAKAKGGDDKASAWIQPSGTKAYDGKKSQGETQVRYVEGGPLYGIGKEIAGIPLLPEIAGFASGDPYVYAALKGTQLGVQGVDPLEAGLQIGGTIFATNLLSDVISAPTEVTPVGGTPGVSEVFPVDMSVGGTVTPLPPVDAGLPSYGLLDGVTFPGQGLQVPSISSPEISLVPAGTPLPGEGLLLPSSPGIPIMGGGQGLTVDVPGGTVGATGFTPSDAVPSLGDPSSFINDPDVLGKDVIEVPEESLSLRDVFRGARLVNSLIGGGEQPAGRPIEMPQTQPTGVSPLDLMRISASTPNVYGLLTQARPRISPSFNLLTGEPISPRFSLIG
jgi:hypothetical protein